MQKRLGKDGKEFTIYKLRTMNAGITVDQSLQIKAYQEGKQGKLENDPRVTFLGKVMRKYWIDELPQIINLIKGDMALIGVRPLAAEEISAYPLEIQHLYAKTKPGFISIHYGRDVRGVEKKLSVMKEYLEQVQVKPIQTKLRYLISVLTGVIFKGERGI